MPTRSQFYLLRRLVKIKVAISDLVYEAAGTLILHLRFALKPCPVLKTVITRQAAQELLTFPLIDNAADIGASDASHGREIALPNLLMNDNAPGSDVLAEALG